MVQIYIEQNGTFKITHFRNLNMVLKSEDFPELSFGPIDGTLIFETIGGTPGPGWAKFKWYIYNTHFKNMVLSQTYEPIAAFKAEIWQKLRKVFPNNLAA